MESVTLTEFLLARIAEEEHRFSVPPIGFLDTLVAPALAQRLLAECEAKRRIVEECAPVGGIARISTGRPGVYDMVDVRYPTDEGEPILRALAAIYADRDGWREEWR